MSNRQQLRQEIQDVIQKHFFMINGSFFNSAFFGEILKLIDRETAEKDRRLKMAEEAIELAERFWYSDHPNDTVEGHEALATIRAALSQLKNQDTTGKE